MAEYPGIGTCNDRPLDSAGNPWSISGLAWKVLNPLVSTVITAIGGITISGVSISGLTISISGLETINRSGFRENWARLDTKIVQERSGFRNTWSGLNDVEREIIQLQDINRSGFTGIVISGVTVDVSGLETINRSGFRGVWTRLDTKIVQEASGFGNTWSGLREVEAEIVQLQGINRSGFSSVQAVVVSGGRTFRNALIDINNATISGVSSVVSGVASKMIKVYAVLLTVEGATDVQWRTGGVNLTGRITLGGKGEGYTNSIPPPAWLLRSTLASGLQLYVSASGTQIGGHVNYWDDDPS